MERGSSMPKMHYLSRWLQVGNVLTPGYSRLSSVEGGIGTVVAQVLASLITRTVKFTIQDMV